MLSLSRLTRASKVVLKRVHMDAISLNSGACTLKHFTAVIIPNHNKDRVFVTASILHFV
jgi:hypothetical protein